MCGLSFPFIIECHKYDGFGSRDGEGGEEDDKILFIKIIFILFYYNF